jgi:drug/metabolite transporter (DMT)-like permease
VPAGFTGTDALLAVMVLVWGINYIVLKAVLREVEPLAFNALRFGLAAAVLALMAWWRGMPVPARADLTRLAALGFLGNTVYQFGFIEGVAHTRAGNAALIMAAVPAQTAVLSHLAGHERLRARAVLGLLLSAAGITTIVLGSGKDVGFGGGMAGDLLVASATLCWSLYVVGAKPLADRYGATVVATWTFGIGAVPLVLLSLPAIAAQDWHRVSGGSWAGLVGSSLGALVLSYLIWFRGVQRLGPARTAVYSNVTPVVVMLCAWPLLGEQPTAWQLLGAAGIFGGLGLTRS